MFRYVLLVALFTLASCAKLDVNKEWEQFKVTHKKVYANEEEEAHRKQVFYENLKKIVQHNAAAENGLKTYRLGVNKFADLTFDEFKASYLGYKHVKNPAPLVHNKNYTKNVPKSVDWRTKGLVTPVKDQGQCGSCWAFSAIASLEGAHAQKTGKLVSLSEQNLMDCSTSYGNQACEGGSMDYAFEYIKANKGVDTEACYKYLAEDESTCRYKSSCKGASLTNYVDVPEGDEDALLSAVSQRVVSVAIDAENDLQLYSGGILASDECYPDSLNHGVTAVGFGASDGTPYWIIKNSWGSDWGENGYFRLYRGSNMCGVAEEASYPLV